MKFKGKLGKNQIKLNILATETKSNRIIDTKREI